MWKFKRISTTIFALILISVLLVTTLSGKGSGDSKSLPENHDCRFQLVISIDEKTTELRNELQLDGKTIERSKCDIKFSNTAQQAMLLNEGMLGYDIAAAQSALGLSKAENVKEKKLQEKISMLKVNFCINFIIIIK